MADKDFVRMMARGRWHEILLAVGMPNECLTTKHGSCPKCREGKDRFRMFDDWVNDGGCVCSTCDAKNAGGFDTVSWWLDIPFSDSVNKVAEIIGHADKPAKKERKSPEEQLEFMQWNDQLAKMFLSHNEGVTVEGLERAGAKMARYQGKAVIAFPCYGEDLSSVVGWVVMSATSKHVTKFDRDGSVEKQVRHKQVAGSESGLIGDVRYLGDPHADVIKTEGLTDLLSLLSVAGFIGVTNSSGAGENPKWMAEVMTSARSVAVIHDADQPGQKGAKRWCAHLAADEDCVVKNVELPYDVMKTHGKDLRDFLLDGPDPLERLETLIKGSERIQPGELKVQKGDDYQEVLDDLQIHVIGENEKGEVMVYSKETKKTSLVKVMGLTKSRMLQVAGLPAKELIGEDGHSMTTVQSALAISAAYRSRIDSSDKPRGIGIYQTDAETLVLSNASHLSVFNGRFEELDAPVCEDLFFEFSGRSWYDHDRLAENLARAGDKSWCTESLAMLSELIDRWTWRNQATDPKVLAGLVAATFVQSIWPWRPHVSIRGASGCGKTSFAKFLFGESHDRSGVFRGLAHSISQSTAAGIRQSVGASSYAIGIDEWDSTGLKTRKEILSLLRTSGGGDRQVFGSSHMKAVEFGLRHIVWIQGIAVGLDSQADANRFLGFDMLAPPPDRYAAWRAPSAPERADAFERVLALAVTHCREAVATSVALQRKWSEAADLDNRLVLNLSVPVAMLAAACGLDANEIFENCVDTIHEESQEIECEEERMLGDIMNLTVRAPAGEEFTLHHVLFSNSTKAFELTQQALQQLGVELAEYDDEQYIAIRLKSIAEKIETESRSIAQVLKRFPGVFIRRRRTDIGNFRFLMVPAGTWNGIGTPSGTEPDAF